MSSRLHLALASTVLAFMFSVNPVTARASRNPLLPTRPRSLIQVNTIFTAARVNNVAKFDSVIAPTFTFMVEAPDSTETPSSTARPHGWLTSIRAASLTSGTTVNQNLAGIGLPPETSRRLEDRLHAQHPGPNDDSREPWQMRSKR
jgi:hypothetical protein